MAKPITYTATHAGQTFTRNSHRTYTHAVVIADSKPGVFSWAGRADLAEKKAAEARRTYPADQVVIVPVVIQ